MYNLGDLPDGPGDVGRRVGATELAPALTRQLLQALVELLQAAGAGGGRHGGGGSAEGGGAG